MLDAVARIQAYTDGLDAESFKSSSITCDAVLHNLMIIGEAARHIPAEFQSQSQVPWHLMKGMRNVLVHDYLNVDLQMIWQTVQVDLPHLIEPLTTLLAQSQPDQ